MKISVLCVFTGLLLVSVAPLLAQEDPFKSNVRPTEHLSPEEELKTFTVPDGFEVQLFAAEPDLLKPLNMAFDAKGRLWVSMSQEYPYAAPLDRPGKDLIKILEDTDGDGRADKITTFADGLNIPIGLYPYKNGVIAWSIPDVWFLEDTDGDDVADRRTILYGPFGFERDTHGMNNGFTRGFDGWLYACHGFNNQTTVRGRDGHEISMQSGNTYRMRLHGERIEHYTWGQVNPFGMAQDEYGNLFTADCHSKPIYQLVHYGYYPSFGKPHDGLGFVPQMMTHQHGSTAIGGVTIVTGTGFPKNLRGDAFTGNVMTSRVNCDRLERYGASVKAVERPDFMSTTDPWFRPVNLQYGPDDALYVADFYNKIIGHYEVPLTHPGRDRTSGRIWRIVYAGDDAEGSQARLPDLSELAVEGLILELTSPNLARRMLVTDRLSDHFGKESVAPCRKAMQQSESATVRVHCMWVLSRLGALQLQDLRALVHDADPLVREHAFRALAEFPKWLPEFESFSRQGLKDESPVVRYAAAEFCSQHPRQAHVEELLQAMTSRLYKKEDDQDVILKHALLIALKKQLEVPFIMRAQNPKSQRPDRAALIARAALAVPTEESANYLLDAITVLPEADVDWNAALQVIAANIPQSREAEAIRTIRAKSKGNLELERSRLQAVEQGLARKDRSGTPQLREWADDLAQRLLDAAGNVSAAWKFIPNGGDTRDFWDGETRRCADGKNATFISSFPHGERLTGILRSPAFKAPVTFRFYGCGHRGFPKEPVVDKNFYRLRDAATNELLKEARPPRNDVAQLYEWDLASVAGRKVVFEIVDGDNGRAYAWIAASRFDPPLIAVPDTMPAVVERRLVAAGEMIARYHMEDRAQQAAEILGNPQSSGPVRAAFAEAVLSLKPDRLLSALATLLSEGALSDALADRIVGAILHRDASTVPKLFEDVFSGVAGRTQVELAQRLASSREGGGLLLNLCASGKASPRLLQIEAIRGSLKAAKVPDWEARVQEITKSLPSMQAEVRQLIAERLKKFGSAAKSAERGREVFEKNCKNCHQIGGQGAVVGPQLDGIGNRGRERLTEDILDPNQNVDVAFHAMVLALDDGKVVTGLFRRDEGKVRVLVDQKGKEFTVETDRIVDSSKSPLSLMPENIARDLKESEFYDLLAFLLEQTKKPAEAPSPPAK